MPIPDLLVQKRPDFEKVLDHFSAEAAKIRTGRANPALVEDLLVDYYGTKSPIKQIAGISIPEARQILIQPWDKGSLVFIETAIREADLGLNPGNDGQNIRIVIPPLTEERRKELVKQLNQRVEEARISVRSLREDLWKDIQDLEKQGEIAEDDKFRGKDDLQKLVDEYNQKLEDMRQKKEEDILTV
ncbi:MAG: ribosome recycling factor [Candidatus Moraniibacteriota bacterium]